MRQKRKLFDELMEGVDAMRRQRDGKITLRSHEIEAGRAPMPRPLR